MSPLPFVPDGVRDVLAPLLAVGVTTDAAAEHLHMSRTDAWHWLDNLRVAGDAAFCPCGRGVLWCRPGFTLDRPAQQEGSR